jgi:TonB family protein
MSTRNTIRVLIVCLISALSLNAEPLTDARIIQFVRNGLRGDEIIRLIETAPSISFDLTPSATDQMLKAGITEDVIKAMAAREQGALTTHPPASPSVGTSQKQSAVPPKVIYKEEPHYTKLAFDRSIQGNVQISLVVDPDGLPRDITVTKSLDPGLDASAIETVKRWRFTPGRTNGQPVPVIANVEVNFRIVKNQRPDAWFAPSPALAGETIAPITPYSRPDLVALAHQKREVQFTSLSYRIIPFHRHTDINLPGYARSSCYGSGSAWSYSVNCSSYATPPSSIPIDIAYVDVYQQVRLDGLIYTMKCRAHWVGSACHGLIPDTVFRARIDRTEMRVPIHIGGNMTKMLTAKYKIVDIH